MPFQVYMPGSSEDEVLARMKEKARLREQQEQEALMASQVEDTHFVSPAPSLIRPYAGGARYSPNAEAVAPAAPEGPGFLSRAVTNFGGALSQLGTSPIGQVAPDLLRTLIPQAALTFPSGPIQPPGTEDYKISDLFTPKAELEKPWLDVPNKAAGTRAAALAAERLNNVKTTPPAKAAQAVADTATASSRPTMLVTIDGKTYDYSDPSVRAPKLTGDRVALRERGPGAFVPTYNPDTGSITATQRVPEVATLPEKFRPGVSTMESPARTQLLEYATRQRLGEARRGAERAEMSPREAAELDPRVMAERIKLQRPTDVQMAGQEFRKLYKDSFLAGQQAIERALQMDPTFFQVYQNAKQGDKAADLAFREQAKKIYEAAQDEFLQSGISGLGRDIYRPDAMAAIR